MKPSTYIIATIWICLVLTLFIGQASAWTSSEFTKDEIKSLDKLTNFGTYEIKESAWYDPLQIWTDEVVKSIDLRTNTEQCIDCLSEGTIVLNKDGTLIDDLIWKRSFDKGKTFVDWKGYTNWKLLVEEDVDVFETQCIDLESVYDEKNDTYYTPQECSQVKTGTTKQWNNLDFKKEYKAGTYNYKIEGSKKGSTILDWIIVTNGRQLNQWAVWGAVIGVGGVEASVTINSPANNSIQYTKTVTTSATANVTNGAYLTNASLNLSVNGGAWGVVNTTTVTAIIPDTLNLPANTNTGTSSIYWGQIVVPSEDLYISKVTKYASDTATKTYLYQRTGTATGTLLETKTFSGTEAGPFTTELQNGTSYFIVKGSDGASYTQAWKSGSSSYPYTSTGSKFQSTGRVGVGSGEGTDDVHFAKIETESISQKTSATVTFTNTFNAGDVVDFNYLFGDSDGDVGKSETRRFTIDSTAPTINLSYPTALIDYGRFNGTLQLNFTATDTNLDKVWYNYFPYSTNHNFSELIFDRNNKTAFEFDLNTYSFVLNTPSNAGDYLEAIFYSTGTFGDVWYTEKYSLDACSSSIIYMNKTKPSTETYYTFRCGDTQIGQYTHGRFGDIPYLAEIRYIKSIAGATSGVYNQTNITLSTKKNVTIYANDTAGNLYSEVFGWDYKVFENGRSYTSSVIVTSLDTFIINVTADVSLTSVYLNYNGTEYSTSLSGGVYTKQLTVPTVTQDSVMQIYWRFVYGGINITSDITNQSINKLTFNICNATINNTLINFTTKSATNPFPIVNSTFKSSWMLSASIGATPTNFTYEDIEGNKSSYAFCTNTNATTLYADADIEYDGSGYALNFYYLNDANLTTTNTQNISLYLLNDTLSTVTILKLVSSSQQPQADHQINIQSYDVGTGTFYLVGMAKTNFNGEDVAYLNWYDTLYRFVVLDEDGEVVKTTGTTKVSSTPTTIELENEITFPYDKFEDFVYSLYYDNATSNFVLTYTKPSGEVDEACLRVYKHGDGNDTLVCDTCETSASATLFCNVASYGNGTYIGIFYATGSFSLVDWIYEYIGGTFQTTIYNLLGNEDASFYAFFFASLITVALFINAVFGIIALIIGIIGASALGFTALQWGQMTGVIIIGGFIIWLLKR